MTATTKSFDSFYLAKELSIQGCPIFYVNTMGVEYKKYRPSWPKPFFIKGGISRLGFKLIMNLDLSYLEFAGRVPQKKNPIFSNSLQRTEVKGSAKSR